MRVSLSASRNTKTEDIPMLGILGIVRYRRWEVNNMEYSDEVKIFLLNLLHAIASFMRHTHYEEYIWRY